MNLFGRSKSPHLQIRQNLAEKLGLVHDVRRVLGHLLHLAVDGEVGRAKRARGVLGKPVRVCILAVVDQALQHVEQELLRRRERLTHRPVFFLWPANIVKQF